MLARCDLCKYCVDRSYYWRSPCDPPNMIVGNTNKRNKRGECKAFRISWWQVFRRSI